MVSVAQKLNTKEEWRQEQDYLDDEIREAKATTTNNCFGF
jgi:hypothetical protein